MKNIELGQRLRDLREYHHYTQEYISSKLNIERPSYSNYECGKRTPPLDLIIRLCDFYQISLDDLLRSPKFSPCAATMEDILPSSGEDEEALLHFYRLLPDASKREILQYLEFKLQQSKKQ
ncbi:helix-turn-helix domain-containing protein [Lachnospiraceae bacterium 46-15]